MCGYIHLFGGGMTGDMVIQAPAESDGLFSRSNPASQTCALRQLTEVILERSRKQREMIVRVRL
jgi:hypothetical protein